jgi:hypothetical protein
VGLLQKHMIRELRVAGRGGWVDDLNVYLPTDRRAALAYGTTLPEHAYGAAMFADVTGFTPLAEALTQDLGPRHGAEELTALLNQVYSALITQIERFGGTVVGFSGDAITCWFDDTGVGGWELGIGTAHSTPNSQPLPRCEHWLRLWQCGRPWPILPLSQLPLAARSR